MIPSLIIALREVLEIALIVGIVLGYLNKTKQTRHKKTVWSAVGLAILASILGAILFNVLAGGFQGRAEEIFEGAVSLLGAVLLTTMILWMMKQKKISQELQEDVAKQISKSRDWGLFLLVFVSVLREGIETVIFLWTAQTISGDNNLWGAILGMIIAMTIGYLTFVGLMKINLKKFFNVTSILLIFFAAGLVAYGVHELSEAKILPELIEHVWDINPAINADGGYSALHENGWLGGILKGLFGYNGNPSLLEVIAYLAYLSTALILFKKNSKS